MDTTTRVEPPVRAGRREWIGLAVLALPTLLLALDFSVLFLALPSLGADLGADNAQQLWILDIYGFMVAGFLVTMGTLGDRIGRRKLLMIGAAAFGLVSLMAAYSTSAEMLIGARALLGIAGATLMPSTLALISNMFKDAKQRGMAIGLWATCLMIGVAIGPVVGGLLLESFWWGSAFLMGVPVMVVLLIAAPLLLPEYRNAGSGRLDLYSVALSLAAILPIIYGLKKIAAEGPSPQYVIAMVVGLAIGVVFVRRQRALPDPLLDMRLFGNRSFSGAFGILLIGGAAAAGIGFLFTQYLQLVEGLSPLRAGLWLIPYTIGMIAGALICPMIARRVRPGFVIAGGLVIQAIGFLVLSQVPVTAGMLTAQAGLILVFIGQSPIFVLGTTLLVSAAPPEKAGSASSLSQTSSDFGVALGIAAMGSIGAAVYRTQLADTAPDLPAEAAGAAGESLVGAVNAAATLPGSVGTALIDAGREAFTTGFNTAAAVGAPVAILLAVVAAVLLRHVGATGSGEQPPAEAEAADPAATPATP
ncbi:MAG TPA: MFS transporter, partial [Pseudonocardiaceae bacterium]